jgi:hypothetical protein
VGCDIHGFIQIRKPGGTWKRHATTQLNIPDDRHYGVFAALAGVRGEPTHVTPELRGWVPDDELRWDDPGSQTSAARNANFHSATWLTAIEALDALSMSELQDTTLGRVLRGVAREFGPDSVRIVIWFDS